MNNPISITPKCFNQKILSIVIPVYCNSESLLEIFTQISILKSENFPSLRVEVVFVDDGSTDDSWNQLEKIYFANKNDVTLVKLSRNFGQVNAILAGYKAASGDAIITMSADLQDPISIIVSMVSKWESGQEVVVAYRKERQDDFLSRIFSRVAYGLAKRANPLMPEGGFDYFLLSKRAVELLLSFKGRHRFFQGDVLWLGLPITFIPYTRMRRKFGKSGWTFKKKTKYFFDLILDSSYFPIRLMSGLGLLIALAGFLYGLTIAYIWFFNDTPFIGWAPIMITLLIIGGAIMIMLGIIGEYLWRIYDDVKDRPLYVIEKQSTAGSACSDVEL